MSWQLRVAPVGGGQRRSQFPCRLPCLRCTALVGVAEHSCDRLIPDLNRCTFAGFHLLQALVEGSIEVADLPRLWNEKMKEYLGCEPESDARGVLQVH